MDVDKITAGFRQVLEGLGVDLNSPELRETPRRTAEAWVEEICAGLAVEDFRITPIPLAEGDQTSLVALSGIPVKSLCAHHLLPFYGRATVAYLPGDAICGLSKLSRVVDHYARRPQLQEHLTHQVAACVERSLAPRGVGVMVQASHFCMEMRGVNHPGTMTTTALLGVFREDPALRGELMTLAAQHERDGYRAG